MSRLLKAFLVFAVLVALVGIAGFLILPPILKSVLSEKLSTALHREVAIEKITVNPCVLSATLKGVIIKERDRSSPFLSFEELYVNAEGIYSLSKAL